MVLPKLYSNSVNFNLQRNVDEVVNMQKGTLNETDNNIFCFSNFDSGCM